MTRSLSMSAVLSIGLVGQVAVSPPVAAEPVTEANLIGMWQGPSIFEIDTAMTGALEEGVDTCGAIRWHFRADRTIQLGGTPSHDRLGEDPSGASFARAGYPPIGYWFIGAPYDSPRIEGDTVAQPGEHTRYLDLYLLTMDEGYIGSLRDLDYSPRPRAISLSFRLDGNVDGAWLLTLVDAASWSRFDGSNGTDTSPPTFRLCPG